MLRKQPQRLEETFFGRRGCRRYPPKVALLWSNPPKWLPGKNMAARSAALSGCGRAGRPGGGAPKGGSMGGLGWRRRAVVVRLHLQPAAQFCTLLRHRGGRRRHTGGLIGLRPGRVEVYRIPLIRPSVPLRLVSAVLARFLGLGLRRWRYARRRELKSGGSPRALETRRCPLAKHMAAERYARA